jgi:hypothetical protein
MRTPLQLCPVHLYERLLCDEDCAEARKEFSKLCHAFTMLWYDRRRGIPARHYTRRTRSRYGRRDDRPVAVVWRAA